MPLLDAVYRMYCTTLHLRWSKCFLVSQQQDKIDNLSGNVNPYEQNEMKI